jgi:hypothetical protein
MKWNWDPQSWKKSSKILLGIVTIWPFIYLGLFFVGIFSMMLFLESTEKRSARSCGNVDLLQLDRKIKNGEIKQLTVRPREIVALDRTGNCEFTIAVTNESTRDEIVSEARAVVDGRPRVEKIEEVSADKRQVSPFLPAGFLGIFAIHMLSVLVMLGLMPLYILLAVKNERLDQTMRIVWVVLFCTMGMVVNPVYWYLYIWKKRPNAPVPRASVVGIPSVS